MKFKLFALLFITFGCISPLSFTTVQAAPTESVVVSDQKSNDEFKKALENFKPLVGIPGVGTPNANGVVDIGGLTFGDYINALYRLSISLAALLAVIKIIAAGVKYMFSDIVTHKEEAKKDIQGALIGLLVIIGAVIILNTVNTDITQNQILMDPANVDGSDNTILEDIAAIQIGKLNSAQENCDKKYKTTCEVITGLTKEGCEKYRGGTFIPGYTINAVGDIIGAGNFRDWCMAPPGFIPGHDKVLQPNQEVLNCSGGRSCVAGGRGPICTDNGPITCVAAKTNCTESGRQVISESGNTIICDGKSTQQIIDEKAVIDQNILIAKQNCFTEGKKWTGTTCIVLNNNEKAFPEPGLNFELFMESDPGAVQELNQLCNRDTTGWRFDFRTKLCIK